MFNADRREFVKGLAGTVGLKRVAGNLGDSSSSVRRTPRLEKTVLGNRIRYPREFSGRELKLIAFPLGGIGTGSISIGGRGQFCDWEIYNRPDKGRSPDYAFACIWIRSRSSTPIAHVLEAELQPPYAGASGLGSRNAPGLSRLEGATFIGEFPLAHINFHDSRLPVQISLEAFSPFIPLDPDSSGYPIAVLRYHVHNLTKEIITVSIALSLDNPTAIENSERRDGSSDGRVNEFRRDRTGMLQGLYMTNPAVRETDPQKGSFVLGVVGAASGRVSYLRGWPAARWWTSPLLFWDDFSHDGELGPEASKRNLVGSICLQRVIEPAHKSEYTFLFAWHFPNRTSGWSGWSAPKGHEDDILGNYYCTRFSDAWVAAEDFVKRLPELERRTKTFADAIRVSTLPGALRDAAMANLSTLVTQTCFRTADGEFHGFEGCADHRGCCFGNCTHVWNYETATQFLFPSLARSLRKAAFGFSQDPQGGMRFRQLLPDGIERFGFAAADGQMGQIMKAYIDWKLSGDTDWLRSYWPHIQSAIAFAWIPGGWDANRDGVMEGVQHNTYDVEFYGPNPLCGIYYLGALRAAEEMARALGDSNAAFDYHNLFEKGRAWVDANLFNGEFYIQQVHGIPKDQIAPSTVGPMGAEDPEHPEFQLGHGCLADQLIGQYLAYIADLGPLVNRDHIRTTLASIYKYNYRKSLTDHDCVQRVYALNNESAILICDYGKGVRPKVPFPYFAESWTGIEYLVATLFIYEGMIEYGLQTIENVRKRFDGERRNPWDEPECGHHYARAMSAWSTLVAFSGFYYHGADKFLSLLPHSKASKFRCFWSTAMGWGLFTVVREKTATWTEVAVIEGYLPLKSIRVWGAGQTTGVKLNDKRLTYTATKRDRTATLVLQDEVVLSTSARITVIA